MEQHLADSASGCSHIEEGSRSTRDSGIVANEVVALFDLEARAKSTAQVRVQVVDAYATGAQCQTCSLFK